MNSFLDIIRPSVLRRVELLPEFTREKNNTLDFCEIFQYPHPRVIAEIKFSTPSMGTVYKGLLNHKEIAKEYAINGACALSILTEPDFFKGDIEYIRDIRQILPNMPILLKDFILHEKQILQASAFGANAILLIAAFLEKRELKKLYQFAADLGLTPIIEVHDRKDLDSALSLSPKIIGVNNRDLKTHKVDLDTSRTLIHGIPDYAYAICESGLRDRTQIDEMGSLGYDGFLIGSALMRNPNPGTSLMATLGGSCES